MQTKGVTATGATARATTATAYSSTYSATPREIATAVAETMRGIEATVAKTTTTTKTSAAAAAVAAAAAAANTTTTARRTTGTTTAAASGAETTPISHLDHLSQLLLLPLCRVGLLPALPLGLLPAPPRRRLGLPRPPLPLPRPPLGLRQGRLRLGDTIGQRLGLVAAVPLRPPQFLACSERFPIVVLCEIFEFQILYSVLSELRNESAQEKMFLKIS